MKEKLIVCCVVAVFFLLSGCTGLVRHPGTVNNGKPVAAQKVDEDGVKKEESAPVGAEVKNPTPPIAGLEMESIDERKSIEKPISKKNIPVQTPVNNRFKKAKKEMNLSGRIFSKKKLSKPGGISFNFDNADLYEVIRTMADILRINYMVDSNIRGNVTIHTAGELDRSDLFPLFFQILELNGLTALKEGNLYKIINKEKISNTPILTRYGRDLKNISGKERMVMQIVPLKYISPQAIIPTLTPLLSHLGTIIPKQESNLFIVIDKSNSLKRILQLVDIFDVDLFENVSHRFFGLQNTESDDAIELINSVMAPYLNLDQSELKVISISRLNTLIAISNNERILDKIGVFIEKIDAQEKSAEPRIFIYKVKNSEADDLASLLNQVFGKKDLIYSDKKNDRADDQTEKSADTNLETKLFFKPDKKNEIKEIPKLNVATGNIGSSASLSGEITIIADSIRNALIVEAVPSDYLAVKQVLTELDVLPRQVLIDVLILDVNLTDSRTLGVEWSFLKDRTGGDTGLLKANLGSSTKGLTFTAGIMDDWVSAVKALATDDRADVLSAPSVLASDNKAATINVVTQIPVTSSTFDTDNGVTTTSVQYRDTGIILSVTPHINDDGMVSMDINQEVSSVVESSADSVNPSFFNRNVNTTLTVKDQQTIVIGGLISETKTDNASGVPGLSSLPLIGFLFGEKKDTVIKNELIIMITPRVITTLSEIDSVSKEFSSKFSDLKNSKRIIDLLSE